MKLAALMNHVCGRISYHLQSCGKGAKRNSLEKLASVVVQSREFLADRVAGAKDILRKIPSLSEISSVLASNDVGVCREFNSSKRGQ